MFLSYLFLNLAAVLAHYAIGVALQPISDDHIAPLLLAVCSRESGHSSPCMLEAPSEAVGRLFGTQSLSHEVHRYRVRPVEASVRSREESGNCCTQLADPLKIWPPSYYPVLLRRLQVDTPGHVRHIRCIRCRTVLVQQLAQSLCGVYLLTLRGTFIGKERLQ